MARCVYGFLADVMAADPKWVTGEGEEVSPGDVRPRDEVILFVPGEDVTVLRAAVPVRSGPQAREAAAYSVEDEIAVSVEDEHVVLAAAGDDLQTPRAIHIVSTEKMTEWTDWLQGHAGLINAKLIAAPSVLPDRTALNVDGTWLAHIDGRAFSIHPDMPAEVSSALIEGCEVSDVPISDALTILSIHAQEAGELVDLRQGAFQAASSRSALDFRVWRTSVILAAAVMLVWLGSSLLQIRALNQETNTLNTRIENAYQAAFPDSSVRSNYVRAVAQELTARGAAQIDFRDASVALYVALEELPNAELRAIRYDDANGGFVARIAYSAYGEDAQLKTALAAAGFSATLGALRQDGTKVVGDVAFGGDS